MAKEARDSIKFLPLINSRDERWDSGYYLTLLFVKMLAIKKNLVDQILTTNDKEKDIVMYCPICESTYSANAGDYWYASDNQKFECCGQTMILARKFVKYIEVK